MLINVFLRGHLMTMDRDIRSWDEAGQRRKVWGRAGTDT